ncbi:MAG: cytochrome c oxidase subunit 3 family protein [Phycisphaerales bacterium]|nr:cytochrome c oxidase subunit 3 family protein [Phycisphaerales bacterium]MCB9835499.1 cytochrome c oxidase subunit 3 family protein [Phycisphaera sp.]
MATIDTHQPALGKDDKSVPLWKRYHHGHHWRTADDEFDAAKIGIWLFLSTEILLFSGMFCAYTLFRLMYPEAIAAGSSYLDWRWGGLNTVVLLISSFTMANAIRCVQLDKQSWARINLIITWLCAALFLAIKLTFEYGPKWAQGKRPGVLFNYPFASETHEPIWWGIYYVSTGIHATHVIGGMALIALLIYRQAKGSYGPSHYTLMEGVGLYWHIVDLVWIFLFPLLYLVH